MMGKGRSILLGAAGVFLCACGKTHWLDKGEAVFVANHAQGINGAPIVGNLRMWGSRLGQGHEILVSHAIAGFGLMPARAGEARTQR